MNAVTQAFYNKMVADATLVALLGTYEGQPAVFTIDPPPGVAVLPYIVSVGAAARAPFDTKNTLGCDIRRDIRCYAPSEGSAVTVDAIAERVYWLFHRQPLVVAGFIVWLVDCSGPLVADEREAYGRIVTVRLVMDVV